MSDSENFDPTILKINSENEESNSLYLMNEFNKTYEERIKYIDSEVGADCIELKYPVFQDWVRDLRIQNLTLVETLEELQEEACQRLLMLEDKLRKDALHFNGENRYQKLENDLRNILEVIRRAREEKTWNADGLNFFQVKYEDIFGKRPNNPEKCLPLNVKISDQISEEIIQSNSQNSNFKDQEIHLLRDQLKQLTRDVKKKDSQINDYTQILLKIPSSLKQKDNQNENLQVDNDFKQYIEQLKALIEEKDKKLVKILEENASLSKEILLLKNNLDLKNKQLLQLEKASLDTHVLVFEVASKHDTIVKMRSDINQLEERLRQADMQTNFKDAIIRDLRRDCRKLAKGSIYNSNFELNRFDTNFCSNSEKTLYEINDNDTESTIIGNESEKTVKNSELEKVEDATIKLLHTELNQMVSQVRARETHISHQNSMILDLQDNLDKLKNELKTITLERDKILIQLTTLKIDTEVEQLKNLMLEMNERILFLERENLELKNKKQTNRLDKSVTVRFDDDCEKDEVESFQQEIFEKKVLNIFGELVNYFGKEISNDVLEKLATGDLSSISQLMLELKQEIDNKDKILNEKNVYIGKMDNELCDLQKQMDKENIANNHLIKSLRNTVKIHEENLYQLQLTKEKLEEELNTLNETLRLFDAKTKGVHEEKNKLEIECKNQLTTISNLREVLEATKRGNIPFDDCCSSSEISILSEQLSDFFDENMKKEKQLDLLKDEILDLNCTIYEMKQDYYCLEERYKQKTKKQTINIENVPLKKKKNISKTFLDIDLDNSIIEKLQQATNNSDYNYLLRNLDLKLFNEQTKEILYQDHQLSRITDLITAMDIHCKKQQIHYSKIINELSEELASLSDQLVASQQESLQQEELMKGTSALEESIVEIEEHNDILQKTIEEYDVRFTQIEHELETSIKENNSLKIQITELKLELDEKEKLIYDLKLQNEKLILQSNLQKSVCRCMQNSTDSDRNNFNARMKNLQDSVSQKTINQKLTSELQKQQKLFTEEKSRILNDNANFIGTIGKMKSQMTILEMAIMKKDNELTKLNVKIIDIVKRENILQSELLSKSERLTQLECEEFRLREFVDDLSHEVVDTKTEQKRREFKIINELELIRKTINNKTIALSKAENLAETLEKENEKIKRDLNIIIKENIILKNDSQKIREKFAVLQGRENTISDLLKANLDKVSFQNKELNRLSICEKNFQMAKDNNKRLISHNTELVCKVQSLQKDYISIRDDYKNLLEVKQQALNALQTARKWQSEQQEREKFISLKITKQNEHIQTLKEDRQMLIEKIKEMHRDSIILSSEIEKYKNNTSNWQSDKNGTSLFVPFREYSRLSKITRYNSDPELNDVELKKIKQMTQRIYRTRKYWENNIQDAINK